MAGGDGDGRAGGSPLQAPPAGRASGEGETSAAPTDSEVRRILFGIMAALFLAALDQTIIAPALPTIGAQLGEVTHIPWLVSGYLLAATAMTPLYGKASDIYGRRPTLYVALSLFLIGSVAGACAPSMLALIVARIVQGLGGGGLIVLPMTIIGDLFAPRERGRYQVYVASVYAVSSLCGPMLGGFLAEHLHWSLIFWINLPIGLLALALSRAALRRLPRHHHPRRLDLPGAAVMAGATVSVLLALTWGGVEYAWRSPQIVALLGGSALLWGAFALRLAVTSEPLIPVGVLTNPVVAAATVSSCFGMGTLIGLIAFTPIFFESVAGLTASESGLAMIPLMVGTVIGATISGRSMGHITHYRRLPVVGLAVAAGAAMLLARFLDALPIAVVELLLGAISMGVGSLLPVTTVAVQNAVALRDLGTATAAMGFFRQLGGALIVAAFGAIVFGGGLPEGALAQMRVLESGGLANSFRSVFLAAAGCFALALAFLFAMEEKPLRAERRRD